MTTSRAVWLAPMVLALIALAPLPYGYYVFLRIALCVAAAYLAWAEYEEVGAINAWFVGLVVLAVVYNPIIRVHLTREIWTGINLTTVAFLGIHMLVCQRRAAKKKLENYGDRT
jgi:hypothetical protein